MDRTSILGDTIDYMKELLEKIHKLRDEIESGPNQFTVVQLLKDMKPNEMLVRNSPKVDIDQSFNPHNIFTKLTLLFLS